MELPEEKTHCLWRPTEPIILSPDIGLKEREKTEKVKQQKDESISILVQHAREQEQKVKEQESIISSLTEQLTEQQEKFTEYQLQTEERFNKLASMILNMQQAPQQAPPLMAQKSSRQKSILPK